MPDMIGQRIGAYEIVSLLGKGGMAQVYRARQQLGGRVTRDVALKLIDARLSLSEEFIARFEREAQTLVSLSHPHILKAFDYGQYEETVYLVMELLPGGSLAQRISGGMLPLSDVSKWLEHIGQALDYAHRQGIVHRDMKPQNVMFDNENNAFLTDFGIVKLLGETSSLTQSNTSIGTPAYMAPEQWTSGRVDARTDLYAFGVMLFEMLGGQVPFTGDTPFRVMYLHTNEMPPSIYSLRPDLPPSLDRVITKILSKDPVARHQSAAALVADFKAALAGASVIALPIIAPPPAPQKPIKKTAPLGPLPNKNTEVLASSKPSLPVAGNSMPGSPWQPPAVAEEALPNIPPAKRTRLPLVIGLAAAAIVAVIIGGVLATLLAGHGGSVTPSPILGNTVVSGGPATQLVAGAPTTQALIAVIAAVTAPATLNSTSTIVTMPSTDLPTVMPATSPPPTTATSAPTMLVPTLVATAAPLDVALIMQTALSQALTETATALTISSTSTSVPATSMPPATATSAPTMLVPTLVATAAPLDVALIMQTALSQALTETATALTVSSAPTSVPATSTPPVTDTSTSAPTTVTPTLPAPATTFDVALIMQTALSQALTETATGWTSSPVPTVSPTPTDDVIGTLVQVALTRTAAISIVSLSTQNALPTSIYTPSATFSPLSVPTAADTSLLLPSTMKVVFADKFTDNSNNWPLSSKPDAGTVQIADNKLQFAIQPNAYLEIMAPATAPSVTDFYFRTLVSYTAPIPWSETSFGVIIHKSAAGYDFIDIQPDTCLFALNTYTAATNADLTLASQSACQTGSQLKNITSFVLTVVGSNNQFTIYVDNVKEAVLVDSAKAYTEGILGLYGLSSQGNAFNLSFADIAIGQ